MTQVAAQHTQEQLRRIHLDQRELQRRLTEVGVPAPTYGNQLDFVEQEDVLYAARDIIDTSEGWAVFAGFDMKPDEGGMLIVNAGIRAAKAGRDVFGTVDGYGGRDGPVREMVDGGINTNVFSALSIKMLGARRKQSAYAHEYVEPVDQRFRAPTTTGYRLTDVLSHSQIGFHNHRKVKGASDRAHGVGPKARATVDGSNLTKHWLSGQRGRNGRQLDPRYDSGFVVEGPAVHTILQGFVGPYDMAQKAVPWLKSWTVDMRATPKSVPLGEPPQLLSAQPESYLPGGVQVTASEPTPPGSQLATQEYLVMKEMVEHAVRSPLIHKITITSPMLMTMPELVALVTYAVENNVEFEILTNGPEMHHIEVRNASIANYEVLLKAGATIREVMDRELHDKGMILGDVAVRKGTGNFNVRSLVEDCENGAVIYDLDAVARCNRYVEHLRSNSREVVLGQTFSRDRIGLDHVKAESKLITPYRTRAWGVLSIPGT